MSSRRYKMGRDRQQSSLLPPSLDDYISDIHVVRAIDCYVDSLDLHAFGFQHTTVNNLQGDGQPAYPPAMLLKLYLYGYFNRVRSSRLLARETRVNIEVMWLAQELTPSHTTIAEFRKNNLKAIKAVNCDFVQVCRELDLYGREEVAIDGTFLHGDASKASIHTKKQLEKQAEQLAKDIEQIETYLADLEHSDQSESELPATEDPQLTEKLQRLKARQATCQERQQQLEQSGETQLSTTDSDARILKKRGQTTAGYNAQIAVDKKHKLLVCAEVVNDGNDRQQLEPMAVQAKQALDVDDLIVDVDTGYDNAVHIKACEDQGITVYVPKTDRESSLEQKGRFPKTVFAYDAENDCYRCPADKLLTRRGQQERDGKTYHHYASDSTDCTDCPHCKNCLTDNMPQRKLSRWEHEEVVDRQRQRMEDAGTEHMKTRAALAEHPFGTIKCQMGYRHFLMRGLEKVNTEFSLQMLTYNFKRVMTILGSIALQDHLNTRIVG